ncbi:MAG: trigger factor [Phycisphaerales bacterium]|nr:MAG: trigger factor [Phycisphaerales bacterium]
MADEEATLEQDTTDDGAQEPEAPEESETSEAELTDEERQMAELKEALQVQKEDIGPLRLKLTITVPRDTLEGRMHEQFEELRRDSVVPGFRKGHAPMKLVEKRFAPDVGNELVGKLLASSFLAAMEKESIKIVGDPLVWVHTTEQRADEHGHTRPVEVEKLVSVTEALNIIKMPKEGPLTYVCEAELQPEFELPSVEGIKVKRPVIEVTDKQIDEQLLQLQKQRATYVPVESGAVEANDLLYVDLKIYVGDELVHSADNEEVAARGMRLWGVPLPTLGAVLEGRSRDETVTAEGVVPDEHEQISYRGQSARFEFVIREIKRLTVPPMDAAALAAAGVESEEELRARIREMLESRVEQMVQQNMRGQIADYLIEHTDMMLPERLSMRQSGRLLRRRMIELYREGVPEPEIRSNLDALVMASEAQAAVRLKLDFILDKLTEEHKIEVEEYEINGAIAEIAARQNKRFDRVRDELARNDGLTTLYLEIRNQKMLDEILDQAEITEVDATKPAE